jgi:hypothetical protein
MFVHVTTFTSGFQRSRSVAEMFDELSIELQVSPDTTVWYNVQFENEPDARLLGGPVGVLVGLVLVVVVVVDGGAMTQ